MSRWTFRLVMIPLVSLLSVLTAPFIALALPMWALSCALGGVAWLCSWTANGLLDGSRALLDLVDSPAHALDDIRRYGEGDGV